MVILLLFTLWVRSIAITGDSIVSENELRAAMILKKPFLFQKSVFHKEVLQGDIDALRLVYMKYGLLDPNIEADYSIDSIGAVDIAINVEEGRQTSVGQIRLSGNKIFNEENLNSVITTRTGLPFNPLALEEDYLRIIMYYDDIGYHDTKVTSKVSIDKDADIEYQITEGQKMYIADVKTVGADEMQKGRLKSAIALKDGSLLTNRKIAGAKKRLYDLNVFLRVRTREESVSGGRRVIFALEPREPINLGLKIGYSTLDGPKAVFTIQHNNLYGSLRKIMVLGKISWNERGAEINYRDPITFRKWIEHGLGMRIEYRQELGYKIQRFGGYGIISPKPFSIRYDIERITIYDVEIETLATEGREWLRTFSLTFSKDFRDNLIRPTKGSVITNRIEFAGIFPEAQSNFIRDELRYRLFLPLLGSVTALRGDVGIAKSSSPSTEIPIHSRFFLGGATTVRGYRENMIGPADRRSNPYGGERYLLFSCEERIPIFWQFSGTVFVDVGSLEQKFDGKDFEFKTGIGAGLRLHTPIGPIRFDYGRNLEGSGVFYFAIGEAF